MNTAVYRTTATLAVTLSGFLLGGLTHGHSPTEVAATRPVDTIKAQVRAGAEDITVDTLVVSYALKTSASVNAASRAVRLNIAREHLRTASATASALPAALTGFGTTRVTVREDLTRTLSALASEVEVMINCEKVRTPACDSAATVTRQSQAGAGAGAAVVKLMQAAHVDQKFVTAASSLIQKALATARASTLDTATLRSAATALAPTMATPTPTTPTTTSPGLRPDR